MKEARILADLLAGQAVASGDATDYLRDLVVNRVALPDRWRADVAGRRADNVGIASRWLVRWAAEKGINEADPRYTTLGSLLVPVLTDVGADVAAPAVAVIVSYDLYRARDVRDDLIARYQVPDVRPPIPDGLAQAADPAESLALQSAGKRTPLLLDVDSLATGTKSEIVGRIGHTAVLYRRNPERNRIVLPG